jgi:hypothetical protein
MLPSNDGGVGSEGESLVHAASNAAQHTAETTRETETDMGHQKMVQADQ